MDAALIEVFKLFGVGAGIFILMWKWMQEKDKRIKSLEDDRQMYLEKMEDLNEFRRIEGREGLEVLKESTLVLERIESILVRLNPPREDP